MKKIVLVLVLLSSICKAQKLDYEVLADKYGRMHLTTLQEYLKIPCDANFKEDILKNYIWVENQFTQRGFTAKKLETAAIPVMLLEKKSTNVKAKTIMFYYHSDGQPVKKEEWNQADPFVPVLKQLNKVNNNWEEISFENLNGSIDPEWRIFGRASSDDKGPGVMLLAALDAIASKNVSPNYNLKILVDFEEEKGSPNLPSIIDSHKSELASDLLLIFDGPAHASNLPTITFGARGISTITLTTYGPLSPLHSGHYGNYAPNPALRMAKLLAGMKDDEGKVIIPGFYEGIKLDAATKAKINSVPDNLPEMNKRLGIKTPDKVGQNYQESLIYPSLNIRGLKSGEVGALAATIIPDKAIAEIDIRTVTATNPDKLVKNVKDYITANGYLIVTEDPTLEQRLQNDKICKINTRPAYGAFSTDMNGELGKWIEKAISKSTDKKIVRLPTMGGSVPISPFVSKLRANAIIVPTVNTDNNQHSSNENFRLGNYFEGIKTMIGLLTESF
jgi:acetylornithine deacetylase/succinyl-diaminopimelate desuccinylase-like protein